MPPVVSRSSSDSDESHSSSDTTPSTLKEPQPSPSRSSHTPVTSHATDRSTIHDIVRRNATPRCSTPVVTDANKAPLSSSLHGESSSLSSRLSQFLVAYRRFVTQSPTHQDRSLKVLQYTFWLASALCQRTNRPNGHAAFQALSTEISFSRYVTRLLQWPMALHAAFTDGWVVASRGGGRRTMEGNTSTNSSSISSSNTTTTTTTTTQLVLRYLGRILAWSMVVYYPAEHLAFIEWKTGVSPVSVLSSLPIPFNVLLPPWLTRQRRQAARTQTTTTTTCCVPVGPSADRWSTISCQCWCIYVVTELVQCVVQWKELVEEQQRELQTEITTQPKILSPAAATKLDRKDRDARNAAAAAAADNEFDTADDTTNPPTSRSSTTTTAVVEREHALHQIKLQLIRNLLFLLPTLSWSGFDAKLVSLVLPQQRQQQQQQHPGGGTSTSRSPISIPANLVKALMTTEAFVGIYQSIHGMRW